MPYIVQNIRDELDPEINHLSISIASEGELNYVITKLCKAYCENQGGNYAANNAVVGVLECAKIEFYRRNTVPYEETKIGENGDVY